MKGWERGGISARDKLHKAPVITSTVRNRRHRTSLPERPVLHASRRDGRVSGIVDSSPRRTSLSDMAQFDSIVLKQASIDPEHT